MELGLSVLLSQVAELWGGYCSGQSGYVPHKAVHRLPSSPNVHPRCCTVYPAKRGSHIPWVESTISLPKVKPRVWLAVVCVWSEHLLSRCGLVLSAAAAGDEQVTFLSSFNQQ